MALTPQIENQLNINKTIQQIPSKTYKLNLDTIRTYYDNESQSFKSIQTDTIQGFIDNLDAIKQAVYHILMTERYANSIYDDNYGVELQQYIGTDLEYIETTIEETLKEALTHDLRILDVRVTSIQNIENDIVLVNFDVYSIYGNLSMEVNVNV